ncbi:MAG: hypothetical protein M0R46_10290 [Candidatus Muirbacterium halophilum]|nr:hypothetical protein [Candidatus Muirbacterium halophilum]
MKYIYIKLNNIMQKLEIKIIDNQEENIKDVDLNSYEAQQLLMKYNLSNQQQYSTNVVETPINNGLTFEEMVKIEEDKRKAEENRLNHLRNGQTPITFDGNNGYNTETKLSSTDDGFSFKIHIVSDMNIPTNY